MTSYSKEPSNKHPRTCNYVWLWLMRDFRQKHEEKCKVMELPETSSISHEFLTGSSYKGEWQKGRGMHGDGEYKFTNGAIYKGGFFEGAFHGKGELQYETPTGKAVICGQWNKGQMMERRVLFDDALEYDDKDWQYCKMPDRRYTREHADGLQPAGKSFLTADQPYEIPEGYIDSGDGFFNHKSNMIYEHDDYTKIIRSPNSNEQKWILDNCRMEKMDMIIGPRQDLYETFSEPTALLEPEPPSQANYIKLTKKQSVFENYGEFDGAPLFYDASKGTDAGPPKQQFKQSPLAVTEHV